MATPRGRAGNEDNLPILRRDGRHQRPHDRHPGGARAGQASISRTFARQAGRFTRQRAQGRPTSQVPDNRRGGREMTTTPINVIVRPGGAS